MGIITKLARLVVWQVPIWYLFIAWFVWVIYSLRGRDDTRVLIKPMIITLDDEGRREAARWLRYEMERAGYVAYGDDNIGQYWQRSED